MAAQAAGTKDVDSGILDRWSLLHMAAGIVMALLLPGFAALALLVLWEPFELLVLSPLLDPRGIHIANETLTNSLMDLVSDSAGVLIGMYVVRPLLGWPTLWSVLTG